MAQAFDAGASAADPLSSLLAAYPAGLILLRDSLAASGHFLLPWLTAACVKQGHKVVFVAAAYSPAKHTGALKKLGIACSSSSSSSGQQPQQGNPVTFVSVADAVQQADKQQQQQPHQCLELLVQQVHTAARQLLLATPTPAHQQQPGGGGCGLTVIVDSLSCLSALAGGGSSSSQVMQAVLQQLAALGEQLQQATPCCYRLVLLAARDVPEQQQLLLSAASRAHVTADISPLEGKTAALDGSMTLTLRRAPPAALSAPSSVSSVGAPGSSSVWLFRCGDVGVRWLSEVHGKELMGA